ncbi:ABC transporter ATP-binding protein [Arcanobacterium pinnipediorum]|uniref:ABC transporter ATP-binding protein n=1 Tax=Arcanobacterium pinnipediorum TaxID=1503041 RepID=A0ABY5AIX5_9ACTO|nr:ABC transporter ATP-binding protein [Arcanobacterium pinnipediorum]USR79706.1 ABC transporter ATP-binding protein [Arcanobacterium pinnipediorum]
MMDIRNIHAHYTPGNPVLRGVNLRVQPGSITTVLGASGSGKTTLLRVLVGLHTPSQGHIECAGRDITTLPTHQRKIGLVPQNGALFTHLNVAENIAYGLRGVRRRHAARHPRVLEMLDMIGLAGYATRRPDQLSGGQQQRVALARALAPQPDAMLLDEPFSALDPDLRQRLRSEFFDLMRLHNLPTILITHDREEAFAVSDHIAILDEGIICDG